MVTTPHSTAQCTVFTCASNVCGLRKRPIYPSSIAYIARQQDCWPKFHRMAICQVARRRVSRETSNFAGIGNFWQLFGLNPNLKCPPCTPGARRGGDEDGNATHWESGIRPGRSSDTKALGRIAVRVPYPTATRVQARPAYSCQRYGLQEFLQVATDLGAAMGPPAPGPAMGPPAHGADGLTLVRGEIVD